MTQALYLFTRAHVRDVQFTFSWHKQLLFLERPPVTHVNLFPSFSSIPISQRQTKSCPMIRPTCNSNHTEIGMRNTLHIKLDAQCLPRFIRSSAWTDVPWRGQGSESGYTNISSPADRVQVVYWDSCICGPNNQSDIRPTSRFLLVGK